MPNLRCILSLVLCLGAADAAHAESCSLKRVASIEGEPAENDQILMTASINHHPVKLFLDTGSSFTGSLFPRSAEALQLPLAEIGNYRISTTTGHEFRFFATVNSLRLDQLELGNRQFPVWPDDGTHDRSAAAGVLGAGFLRQFDLELDPAAHKVNLFSQDHCPGKVVYWTREYVDAPLKLLNSGHVVLAMTLDGKPIDAVLDTGADGAFLSLPAAHRLFGITPDTPGVEQIDNPNSHTKRYRYAFRSLSLAGIEIGHPAISILEDQVQRPLTMTDFSTVAPPTDEPFRLPDLIVGMHILRKLHVYIAYGERHFYASAPDAH